MEFLSRMEACEYLGFGRTKLDKLRNQGKLAYYRDGGRILFKKVDLDAYRESCRVSAIKAKVLAANCGTIRKRRKPPQT